MLPQQRFIHVHANMNERVSETLIIKERWSLTGEVFHKQFPLYYITKGQRVQIIICIVRHLMQQATTHGGWHCWLLDVSHGHVVSFCWHWYIASLVQLQIINLPLHNRFTHITRVNRVGKKIIWCTCYINIVWPNANDHILAFTVGGGKKLSQFQKQSGWASWFITIIVSKQRQQW